MKHLVNHLLTSHLGRIALLTMPLLLAVAAPASAAKYNGTGYYNYFPDPPPSCTCLLAGGGADLVTFVGQTVNAVSVVHNPGPNADTFTCKSSGFTSILNGSFATRANSSGPTSNGPTSR